MRIVNVPRESLLSKSDEEWEECSDEEFWARVKEGIEEMIENDNEAYHLRQPLRLCLPQLQYDNFEDYLIERGLAEKGVVPYWIEIY